MTNHPAIRFLQSQPLLLGVGFAILIVIGIATAWLVAELREQNAETVEALDVQNKLYKLLLDVRRAETAQRGILIAGTSDYQSDFDEGIAAIGVTLEEVRTAIAGEAVQLRALSDIEPVIRAKMDEMQETLRLFRAGDLPAAFALVRAGAGRAQMETIRATVDRLASVERARLSERRDQTSRLGLALLAVTLAGTALIVALTGAMLLLIRRSNQQRDQARVSLQTAYDSLELLVDERTVDLREANDEIQRFAYIVSHDLRSPLVNIMGFTSELEALKADLLARMAALRGDDQSGAEGDQAVGNDFDEALGFIKTSIGKMDRLINAILRLSREGQRQFRPELIDMGGLLEAISDTMQHQASQAGAEIKVNGLPPVTSDRLALEQVFSNLLDNALKYSRADTPGRIEVNGRSTPTHVVYDVADNGRGIDPKDHQRVFELFRRAGTQDRPGEGIGLAHVRALVRRLGGSMDVKSELGSGSVFTVSLPRRWTQERNAA